MALGGRIRDPVHGYIRFTRVERRLIDDALVQRLRYVGQAGLAHLVFPEVRTARFSHSLGVMQLSSQFLSTSLENAAAPLRESIEGLMAKAVSIATAGFAPDDDKVVKTLTEDGLRTANSVSDSARAAALLIEQGLRLAGLVHDLGHLPFSHDFEYALQRLFESHRDSALERFPALTSQSNLAIHEQVGYRVAQTLVHKIFDDGSGDRFEGDLARASFSIAEKILLAVPPLDPGLSVLGSQALDVDALWWWLHSLMAGEIDVDRCDYLLRDARNYGFEFASYDLERLVNHLTVVRPLADRNLLETAVLPQGVSAAESFYLARYRAYTWGPFHHKVSQIAAALQQSILVLLEPAFSGTGEADLVQFLQDIEMVAADEGARLHKTAPGLLDRFRRYDDGWLMNYIRDAASRCSPAQQAWLDLVCWRAAGPKSLWKRSGDFPVDLRAFNASLPDRNDPNAAAQWDTVVDGLAQRGVLVIRHHFSPFGREPGSSSSRLKVSESNGTLHPLTDISHMTAALPDLWKADVQVFAASAADSAHLSAREVAEQLQQASASQGGKP